MSLINNFFKKNEENNNEIKAINIDRKRIIVYDYFIDEDLGQIERQSELGFQMMRTLWSKGFRNYFENNEDNKSLLEKLKSANDAYRRGNYYSALSIYNEIVTQEPELFESLFYYMRCCERVLSNTLLEHEIPMDNKLKRQNYQKIDSDIFYIRCKWCGRYNAYIDPDEPTFGIFSTSNCCESCRRMYPVPSLMWDSPDGRAYSYFRGSFLDEKFYKEFEMDYDPHPMRDNAEESF